MIQPIMKEVSFFLQQKSEPATQLDVQVGQDSTGYFGSQRFTPAWVWRPT